MTKLEPALPDPAGVKLFLDDLLAKWRAGVKEIRDEFPYPNEDEAAFHMARIVNEENSHPLFRNDLYTVSVRKAITEGGAMIHLSIKRNDRQPIHDWRDLQEIKNQLVGPECEAVELYPAESRLMDSANQYHLWCVPDDEYRFPFGYEGRAVTEMSIGQSVNRPRKKGG